MSKLAITKQVPLSQRMSTLVKERVDQLGIKFPEYVRHLILEDTKHLVDNIPYVTEEEEESIRKSRRDLENGDTVTLNNKKEIKEYFENLQSQALDE